jgi:hypothetical protein
MEDVRQLVRYDEAQPVVVVLQGGVAGGWWEEDVDAVGGKHEGGAVRRVEVIHQRQVHGLARRVELGAEQPVRALRLARREARYVAVRRAEMDTEVRGVERAPAAGRIDLSVGRGGEQEQNENAERGTRKSELERRVVRLSTPPLMFRVPHSAFRTGLIHQSPLSP